MEVFRGEAARLGRDLWLVADPVELYRQSCLERSDDIPLVQRTPGKAEAGQYDHHGFQAVLIMYAVFDGSGYDGRNQSAGAECPGYKSRVCGHRLVVRHVWWR